MIQQKLPGGQNRVYNNALGSAAVCNHAEREGKHIRAEARHRSFVLE
jgi:hypothetical protein